MAFLSLLLRAGIVLGLAVSAGADAPTTVLTDTQPISGFELSHDTVLSSGGISDPTVVVQKSIYWWDGSGDCSIPKDGTIRLRAAVTSATRTLARSCNLFEGSVFNVVRDDDYAYFFENGQLQRKALSAPTGAAALVLKTPPFSPTLHHLNSALDLKDGLLYWSDFNSGTRQTTVYRMTNNASLAPEALFSVTGDGWITKLKFFQYADPFGSPVDAIAALFSDGKLYRCDLATPAPVLLATGVTDFVIHHVITPTATATTIYAARGTSAHVFPATAPPSTVLKIDLDSGFSATIYSVDPSTKNQIVSITTDSDKVVPDAGTAVPKNLYISENVASCDVASCTVVDTRIKRRTLPAGVGGWGEIVDTAGGDNLRSDDHWLYMRSPDGFSIERISTGAPVIELDVMAEALEVTQETQDLTHSVPLISSKLTFVRGYAHLAANTSSQPAYKTDAKLSVYRGTTLLGPALAPLNSPSLDTTGDLDTRRQSTDQAFLFQLPAAWTIPGAIRLELRVNVSGAILESSGAAGDLTANNSVTLSAVSFVPGADPCFIFVPVRSSTGPSYTPDISLAGIFNRATSFLPVAQVGSGKFDSNPIEKPVLTFKFKPCFCSDFLTFIEYKPFDMGVVGDTRESPLALFLLECRRAKYHFSPGFSCDDFHYVGAIHASDTSVFNGRGDQPGDCLMARMQTGGNGTCQPAGVSTPAWDLPYGGQILAHEMGHNYGRSHIDQSTSPSACCGPKPGSELDGSYPGDPCWLGATFSGPTAFYGFDPISRTAIPPTNAGDLMTYGYSTWISKYNFNAIRATAPSPLFALTKSGRARDASGDSLLLVQAQVKPAANRVEFAPFYVFPDGVADPALVARSLADAAQLPPTWPYQLRLLDDAGKELSETPCVLTAAAGTGPTVYTVVQFVVFPAGTRRVELVQDGVVQAERLVTANAPSLVVQPPVVDLANQTVTLNWAASDADNDPLLFTVQYSADDGANWEALAADYPYLSKTFSTETMAGSASALFRVFVTDGVNTTFAMTPPFALPRHVPKTRIEGLNEGQRVSFGQRKDLLGLALDAEDGTLPGANLVWSLDGPSPLLTTGNGVALDELAPGTYTATLSGADRDNNVGIATRSFEVVPLSIPEAAAPPLLDGLCADAAYSNATFVRLPLGNGEYAQVFLTHSGGNLYVCFMGLQLSAQLASRVGIRINADGRRPNFPGPGDLGFLVDSDGFPYQEVPSANGMAVTFSPQKGCVAVIQRGSNHWTAEFCIADSLLGGWNHAAGIMLVHDAAHWPPLAQNYQPATWSPAYFGAQPPPAPNRPPVADAGADQNINLGSATTVFLNGSASFDPDGDALSFNWVQLLGPPVTLNNATTATPSFEVAPSNAPASLQFALIVSDGTLFSIPVPTQVRLWPTPSQTLPDTSLEPQAGIVNGQFQLHFTGQPSEKFAILASSNLVDWATLAIRTADFYGRMDFLDFDITNYPARFYRTIPSQ